MNIEEEVEKAISKLNRYKIYWRELPGPVETVLWNATPAQLKKLKWAGKSNIELYLQDRAKEVLRSERAKMNVVLLKVDMKLLPYYVRQEIMESFKIEKMLEHVKSGKAGNTEVEFLLKELAKGGEFKIKEQVEKIRKLLEVQYKHTHKDVKVPEKISKLLMETALRRKPVIEDRLSPKELSKKRRKRR